MQAKCLMRCWKSKIQQARLFLSYKVKYCVMRNPFFLQGRPKLHRYRVMKFAIESSRNEEVTWNPTCFLSRYFHIPNKRRNVHLRIQKFASFFVTSHISFLEKNAKYAQNFSSSLYIVIVRWYYSQILLNIYPLTIVILFCYTHRWIARRPKKSLTCPFIVILYSCTFFDTQLAW